MDTKLLSDGSQVRRKRRHFASGRLQQIEARPVIKSASFAAQSSIETSIETILIRVLLRNIGLGNA